MIFFIILLFYSVIASSGDLPLEAISKIVYEIASSGYRPPRNDGINFSQTDTSNTRPILSQNWAGYRA